MILGFWKFELRFICLGGYGSVSRLEAQMKTMVKALDNIIDDGMKGGTPKEQQDREGTTPDIGQQTHNFNS